MLVDRAAAGVMCVPTGKPGQKTGCDILGPAASEAAWTVQSMACARSADQCAQTWRRPVDIPCSHDPEFDAGLGLATLSSIRAWRALELAGDFVGDRRRSPPRKSARLSLHM